MSDALRAWNMLHRLLNPDAAPFGTPGVRDVEAPCEYYCPPDARDLSGIEKLPECWGDGHYLCRECQSCTLDDAAGGGP